MEDKLLIKAIEKIYSASLAPDQWNNVLKTLADDFHSELSSILTQNTNGSNTQFHGGFGLSSKVESDYVSYYSSTSEILPYTASLSAGELYLDETYPEYKSYVNGETYTDFWRPNRMNHLLSLTLEKTPEKFRTIAFRRSDADGGYRERETTALLRLYPHLKQAIRSNVMLSSTQTVQQSLIDSLDQAQTGILILDDCNKTIFQNKKATKILNDKDGIRLSKDDEVKTASKKEDDALSILLGHSSLSLKAFEEYSPGGNMVVSRPSMRRSYGVLVVPIGPQQIEDISIFTLNTPTNMIFIKDPETEVTLAPEAIEKILGLSRSESKVTALLCEGISVKEIAINLNLTENTIRYYLKMVFQKTDVNTQVGLVRLVLQSVPNF